MGKDQHPKKKRKLTVTGQEVHAEWTKDNEKQVLYRVTADAESGEPITEELRTFDAELPQGELVEFNVQRFDHEQHGTSYTVSQIRAPLGPRVEALEKMVGDLTKRVEELEQPDF